MGTVQENTGAIALTINGLDAAGIDYERKRAPSPEPASPFLAINDPRLGNNQTQVKKPSPETPITRSVPTPKENKSMRETPKADTTREQPTRTPKEKTQAPDKRPAPPATTKPDPARQRTGERSKEPSKILGKAEAKAPSNQLPAAKRPTAPISGNTRPSPATPTTTGTPTSSAPQAKSRWRIFNFFRTPGPGPGPATLLNATKLQSLTADESASKASEPKTPSFKTPALAQPSNPAIARAGSVTPNISPKTRLPDSADKSAGSGTPKHQRAPSRSLDPSPRSGSLQSSSSRPGASPVIELQQPPLKPELTIRDKHRSPTPPPKDPPTPSSQGQINSTAPRMLELEIPDLNFDRYSVMFGTVLRPKHSSLMIRRKAQLEQLRVPANPKVGDYIPCQWVVLITFSSLKLMSKSQLRRTKPPARCHVDKQSLHRKHRRVSLSSRQCQRSQPNPPLRPNPVHSIALLPHRLMGRPSLRPKNHAQIPSLLK